MAIEILNSKLVYFPIPKVACTSLKSFVYNVSYGEEFKNRVESGKNIYIHNWTESYKTIKFHQQDLKFVEEMKKIVAVRDPVKRVLSAYSNRVLFHGELNKGKVNMEMIWKLDLVPRPSVEFFINNIERYSIVSSSILHHVAPVTAYLGSTLDFFDAVFKIEELDQFVYLVNETCGTNVALGHSQSEGPKFHFSDLSRKAQVKLLEYCAGDYALLRDYYSPPKLT